MGTQETKLLAEPQEANTEMLGPKSSSQACLLGKGPLQPLLFQGIAKVL